MQSIPSPPRQGLADALFTATQQRVLGLIFGQPDRSFYASEIIGMTGAGSGAVQRELKRLALTGLVTVRRVGNQKHYQANATSPLYVELCAIARKTFGIGEPLRRALVPLARKIRLAFVFGSVAKRSDRAASDIDLMVVSDKVSHSELYAALERTSRQVGRTVNPTVYSTAEFEERRKEGNAFINRVIAQPKIWIVGSEHDLGP